MTDTASIELHELTKRFQGISALDNASFSLEGPRVVGYLGPNGAGKTTTLKLLTGLLRPDGGWAKINGVDVHENPRRARLAAGALIEMPEPYGTLTVAEALQLVGEFRGMAARDIALETRRFADALELPPLERRCARLSKGQRQRVVLAATLMGDPPVLLLDEPTNGLDPAERVRVRTLLLGLRRDHLVLMSSHLLGEVTETCDEVVFLNQGRVLLKDTVARLSEKFRIREMEVEFSRGVPRTALESMGEWVTTIEPAGERRWRLGFDGRDETRIRLLERLQTLAPVLTYSPIGSALEDSYLRLVSGEPPIPPPPPPAGGTAG